MLTICVNSPIGSLSITEDEGAVVRVDFDGIVPQGATEGKSPLLLRAATQLREYFDGRRERFDLPLAPRGTTFQRACWDALLTIPYGQTRSYADIARQIGRPKACRAVGGANHANPIPIFLPCHRVIGANGALTGFGGGLDKKEALLRLEANRCATIENKPASADGNQP